VLHRRRPDTSAAARVWTAKKEETCATVDWVASIPALILGLPRGTKGLCLMVAMNCPDCRNPVEKDAQFCPKCLAHIKAPSFWRRLIRPFQDRKQASRPVIDIKQTVSIDLTDEGGQHHEYHSLDEVPPEIREAIRRAQTEGVKQTFRSSTSDEHTTRITTKTESDQTVSVFKVQDESGNEKVYYSLEEMPPEIRAAFEQAEAENRREQE